jgi:hypothetical protein
MFTMTAANIPTPISTPADGSGGTDRCHLYRRPTLAPPHHPRVRDHREHGRRDTEDHGEKRVPLHRADALAADESDRRDGHELLQEPHDDSSARFHGQSAGAMWRRYGFDGPGIVTARWTLAGSSHGGTPTRSAHGP